VVNTRDDLTIGLLPPAGAPVHGGKRVVIADAFVAHAPFDRRRAGLRQKPDRQVVARVNHLLTIGRP